MPPDNKDKAIKITLEDLANINAPEISGPLAPPAPPPGAAKVYGRVTDATGEIEQAPEEKGSLFLQGWFYLGLAGMVGALAGWGLCEPWFIDSAGGRAWQTFALVGLVVTLQCVAYAVAESVVERSPKKALIRGGLAIPLGGVLSFVISIIAGLVFVFATGIVVGLGVQTARNPAFWIARGVAWMVLGAAAGLVYGIVGQSAKKTQYGVLGGVLGAGLGGILFDPIALLTKGGALSRGVGFGLFGLATGIAMGLVESALKDRWLYVTAGPLAGKQFILYKSRTTIGSDQQNDIYLFKDPSIQRQHAIVEIDGARVQIRGLGQTYVAGQPARLQVLQTGTTLQIGRYAFRYQERHRK